MNKPNRQFQLYVDGNCVNCGNKRNSKELLCKECSSNPMMEFGGSDSLRVTK